jgi:hypothetical protein
VANGKRNKKKKRNQQSTKKATLPCQKCSFLVTVQAAWKGDVSDKKSFHYLGNVPVVIKGPENKGPAITGGVGMAQFNGIRCGSYTATIDVTSLKRKYDVDPPPDGKSDSTSSDFPGMVFFTIPFHRIGFDIFYPDGKTRVKDLGYLLRRKQGDAPWSQIEAGTLKGEEYKKDFVPRGLYQVSVEALENPAWAKTPAVIGEAVEMRVDVSGLAAGTSGTFQILDARDVKTVLDTVSASVSANGDDFEMKANWTPDANKLKDWKGSKVLFCAKAGKSAAYSAATPVRQKVKYEVVDEAGKKLDADLKLVFADGSEATGQAAGGEAEILCPFGSELRKLNVGQAEKMLIKLEADTTPAAFFRG